jgi:hypothetical protein
MITRHKLHADITNLQFRPKSARNGAPYRIKSQHCGRHTDIEAAKAMLANPDIGVTQIAHRLGVSPATLYRYMPAARTANTPGV